ncbi:timeless protein [Trichuris trichiura]|uniref:Timeless protein n=1 Tax=Trichuris trichiura TaxID=36087 RepID=A0A077ZD48_TRITR|nr:timeless protein [Trichuris trichiura]
MEEINKDLQAAVGSLGFLDGQKYMKEPDCHETLKDIIYFLRRDDVDNTARKFIASCNVIGNDLVPIAICYPDDPDLFDSVMKLLVNLTQPVDILTEHNDRRLMHTNAEASTLLHCLQQSQSAFADERLFVVLTTKLKPLIDMKWHERREEQVVLIQRILTFCKQVLSIPPMKTTSLLVSSWTVADRIILAMEKSKFLDALLDIAKSHSCRDFQFVCLEIIRALLTSQVTCDCQFDENNNSAEQEAQWDEQRKLMLKSQLEDEMRETEKERKMVAARNKRFPSVYAIRGKKAIGGVNDAISLTPKVTTGQLAQDYLKKPKKFGKKQVKAELEPEKLSPFPVRVALKNFCCSLLRTGFCQLMNTCYQTIMRGETRNWWATECYLWAGSFFLRFCRYYSLRLCNLNILTSVSAVHFVQQELQTCVEMTETDKENISRWSRRAQLALQAYCEQIKALWFISQGSDPDAAASASETLGVIFRVVEYRELLISLLKNYNPAHLSKSFLKDLIEGTHFYLEVLDFFCKLHGGSMTVQRKVRQTRRRKKLEKPNKEAATQETSATDSVAAAPKSKEDDWSKLEEELKQALDDPSSIPDDVVPLDFTVEYQFEEQTAGKIKIQNALLEAKAGEAISLLRACKELWPEHETFSCPDEIRSLKTIFFEEYPEREMLESSNQIGDGLDDVIQNDEAAEQAEVEFEMDESDNDDLKPFGIDKRSSIREVSLQADDIIQRYANPTSLQWYFWLLKDFEKNSLRLNHCIVVMLRRVAFEVHLAPMLYQASFFRILQRLGAGRRSRSFRERHKELIAFGEQLLTSFFELLPKNPNLLVEVLFWKSAREAYELQHGYGSFNMSDGAMLSKTETFDAHLKQLYSEFCSVPSRPLESLIGFIEERLQGQYSRKKIIRAMKRCDIPLVLPLSDRRKKSRGQWTADEEAELTRLYNEFKDQQDCCEAIATAMSTGRSKGQVKRKLRQLDLPLKAKVRRSSKRHSSDVRIPEQSEHYDLNVFENDISSSENSHDSTSSSEEEDEDFAPSISLPALVGSLMKSGFGEAIDWLIQVITETIEDNAAQKTSEIGEAIPVVPIEEIHCKAVRRPDFKRLLHELNFWAPDGIQHKYWRIPDTFSVLQLQACVDKLKEACTVGNEGSSMGPAAVELSKSPTPKRFRIASDDSSDEENICINSSSKIENSESAAFDGNFSANISFQNFVSDDDDDDQ